MSKNSERNLETLSRLPLALSKRELQLHYQPLVEANSNKTYGFETLIRWPQADGSYIPTDELIRLAEQSHIVRDITRWVIETSLHQLANWHRSGHLFTLQINISARDLDEPELVDFITHQLKHNVISATYLTLEITESIAIRSLSASSDMLTKLREIGVGISLDDFGTGYSSMTLLNELPLSQLKIDKSFVKGMNNNEKSKAIVKATLDLGKSINLDVIAEGVENQQQVDQLTAMGCKIIQGYHVAQPMAVADLDLWLKKNPSY